MSLTPQLEPTDIPALEQVEDRKEREQLFADNSIYVHEEPAGTRYTKGNHPNAKRRSWQSLDAILRSDANASAALPAKQLRLSRVFTALTILSSMLVVAGAAASAREGLDLNEVSAGGGLLITGGVLTLASGITAGIMYNRARKGYARAVDVYNDSLGLRLGVLTPDGRWRPADDVVVDREGFILLEDKEVLNQREFGPMPPGQPAQPVLPGQPAQPVQPQPQPAPAVQPQPAPAQPVQPQQPQPQPAAQPQPVQPQPQPRTQPVVPQPPRTQPSSTIPTPPPGQAARVQPVRPLALLPAR